MEFTGILKWIMIVAVSATTIAIVVTGTLVLFNNIVFWLIERLSKQLNGYKIMLHYLRVRKDFKIWLDERKEKNIGDENIKNK